MRDQDRRANARVWSRPTQLLAGAGVVLLLGAFLMFLAVPERQVGDVESIENSLRGPVRPTEAVAASISSVSTTAVENSEVVDRTQIIQPNRVSSLDRLGESHHLIPTSLRVGSIGVDAPVEPYGVNPGTGEMDIPNNLRDVAWYEYGPIPGEEGSAVLAAHVDLAGQGPGVFFELREVEPGDRVVVGFSDGSSRDFVIRARVTYDKDELPLDTIFSRQGASVLTLITCGGGFSPSTRSYDSNVVAYAVPLGAAAGAPYGAG